MPVLAACALRLCRSPHGEEGGELILPLSRVKRIMRHAPRARIPALSLVAPPHGIVHLLARSLAAERDFRRAQG